MTFIEREKKGIPYLEQLLAMPRSKFILVQGVLLWGLPTGLIVSMIDLAGSDYTFADWIRKDLWISLGSFIVAGIFFGRWRRRNLEKELKRLKELKDKSAMVQ